MATELQNGAVARLARRLPEGRFPSGVAAPTIVVIVLLVVLTTLTVFLLRVPADPGPPAAAVDAQQRLTASVASGVGASAAEASGDLRTLAARGAELDRDLPGVLATHSSWRGVAVVGPDHAAIASAGRPLQLSALPGVLDGPVLVPLAADGRLPVLLAVPAGEGRMLAAAVDLRPLDVDLDSNAGETLAFGNTSGTVLLSRGAASSKLSESNRAALQSALRSAAANNEGTTPVGADMLLAYAPVVSDRFSAPLDMGVATLMHVPDEVIPSQWTGLVAAVVLAGVTLFVATVLSGALVVPIRRLRASALAVASGSLETDFRHGGPREIRTIAAALHALRTRLRASEDKHRESGRGFPATVAVVLASAAILGWSGWMLLAFGGADAEVPESVLRAERLQTAATTQGVQRSLNDAVADIRGVAAVATGEPAALQPMLDAMVTGHPRYRSAYLVDSAGEVTVKAGRDPMRGTAPVPGEPGLKQENTSGRLPIVYASAPVAGQESRLVAELDVDHLITLLHRGTGQVRLVDDGWRTIASTRGYLAFEAVDEPVLRTAAAQARDRVVSLVGEVGGSRAVATAEPLTGSYSSSLKWTVVQHQRAGELPLAGNDIRRGAQLVALLGIGIATLLFGWHYFVVVVPLRRVARIATRVAGEHGRGEVVYPERADQIGTIASCLDICRQALDDARRLGRDRRPRGAATDRTRRMRPTRPRRETPARQGL
ncbi:HAMP domain-containing protein [Amycolatopsis acidicola]|uniref:histidine kinase n=1 Tax=Amycolatopsis acidicola TaxID=2596893 RepID=A0A5N0VJ86_9PSEU|nr:HAMP domain-containing protein [Amycolatopsis acidicola]KAA9165533.1 HAMP domain-containing protein [Amycolatopsis acidicola]